MRRMRKPGEPQAAAVAATIPDEVTEGAVTDWKPPADSEKKLQVTHVVNGVHEVSATAKVPEKGELQRMVSVAFNNREDISKVYHDAREWLKPTEVGEVGHRLNVGESLLHELTRAALSAKLQRSEWEIENTIVFGAMRVDATERLTSERATQTKAKAITEKDVEAKCLALYPDAYKQQEMERERVQRAVELLDSMLDHVSSRIKTLQGMMAKGR